MVKHKVFALGVLILAVVVEEPDRAQRSRHARIRRRSRKLVRNAG